MRESKLGKSRNQLTPSQLERERKLARKRSHKWYHANPEKQRASTEKWKRAHPERWTAYTRKWRRKWKATKYGVVYPEIVDCQICGREISGSQVCLDHDHKTDQFRGWLCAICNVRLEWFERNREAAIKYLDRFLSRVEIV
jgi:transcription elongation factor Elf1